MGGYLVALGKPTTLTDRKYKDILGGDAFIVKRVPGARSDSMAA
ncbi:MAG TPA: hypothetical protein VIU62_11070 [Chloroflexota bacterium]